MHSQDLASTSGKIALSTWIKDLAILTLVSAIWFCSLLGNRPLTNPDEGRYAEIPREMATSGDFVTPRLDGMKYFEKPPLGYWLSALTFRSFGINEFTIRIWNALFAVMGVIVTYIAATMLHGRAAGIGSAAVLATSLIYYALSQIVLLDMAVSVTISGALFSFIVATRLPRGGKRCSLFLAFYVFMALAVLTKGLIGLVLPGSIIFLWALLLNRWRSLLPCYLTGGAVLFLAIAAPWHFMAAKANPGFLDFYFIHEHFMRFTTRIHRRYEPFWFLWPWLVAGLFPWAIFGLQALNGMLQGGWRERKQHPESWFLAIWIGLIMAFFSVSQSKLIPYILPVFPAAAVLIGTHLSHAWKSREVMMLKRGGLAFVVIAVIGSIAVSLCRTPASHPELAGRLPFLRICLASLLAGGSIAAFAGLWFRKPAIVLATVFSVGVALSITLNMVGEVFDTGSTKDFAMTIKRDMNPEDAVYCIGHYSQDLPVYLERFVSVVDYKGELLFGIECEPDVAASRFTSHECFIKDWCGVGTSYAIVRKWDFDKWFAPTLPCEVLGRTDRLVLVKTKPAALAR